MPVPSSITDLSDTASSNFPQDTDSTGGTVASLPRNISAIIKKQFIRGSDITVSASGSVTINSEYRYFVVGGSGYNITGFSDCFNGRKVTLKFSGALTLVHSASLVLPNSTNITTVAGDVFSFVNESSGVWVLAAGTAISQPLANGSVTTAKLADSNVTTAKIADSNVTTAKVADGNITLAKLASALTSTLGFLASSQSWTGTNTFKGITETVYAINDGAAFEINPANGSIQTITLGASRTPKGTSFATGQSITLQITAGAYTLTWTDTTFGTTGVKWIGGTAPTLSATVTTTVVLWKIGSQVYGKNVGDA